MYIRHTYIAHGYNVGVGFISGITSPLTSDPGHIFVEHTVGAVVHMI